MSYTRKYRKTGKYSRYDPGSKMYTKSDGTLYAMQHKRPIGDIIAKAADVNVNTIYALSKLINKYIEVKLVISDGSSN